MASFLQTAQGGIQPINGKAGSFTEDLKKANQGKPGQNIVVNLANQIIAATQIRIPPNACDPQTALQRAQQQVQQKVRQIIENHIVQQVQNQVIDSAPITNLQKQLQDLQAQEVTESVIQQVETIEQEIQSTLNAIITVAIQQTALQLPQVTKVANSSAAGIKTIGSVAESLAAFVPSQGINMSAYGSVGQKTIQTVSQACSI